MLYYIGFSTLNSPRFSAMLGGAMGLMTKDQCRARTAYYVKTGRLKKPDRCEKCGTVGPVQAHHKRYDDPLDVLWWCQKCNLLEASVRRKGTKYRKTKIVYGTYRAEPARQAKRGDIPGQLTI